MDFFFLEALQKKVHHSSRQCCRLSSGSLHLSANLTWISAFFTAEVPLGKREIPHLPQWSCQKPDVLWTALLMSPCKSVTPSPALLPFISAGGEDGGGVSAGPKQNRCSCFHTPLDTFNERSGHFPAVFGGFEEISGHLQPRVLRQKVVFLTRHLDEFQMCLCWQKLNLKKSFETTGYSRLDARTFF